METDGETSMGYKDACAKSCGSCVLHFLSMPSSNVPSFIKFPFNSYFGVMLRKSLKSTNQHLFGMKWVLWFRVHCTSSQYRLQLYLVSLKFLLNVFWVMLQTIIQSITIQRAITQMVPNVELWFLCTTLPLNALFFCTRFHLISLGVLEKCSWQEVGTDGHTDKQFHYYRPPFVGHKK